MLKEIQAGKLVCMHTIFLCAWDHISGCIHARTFKLDMKHLYIRSRGWTTHLSKFKHPSQECTLYSCVLGTISQAVYMLDHSNLE